jgi:hypothetical protein
MKTSRPYATNSFQSRNNSQSRVLRKAVMLGFVNTRKTATRISSAQACILLLALSMMAGVALLWPMRAALAQQGEGRTDVVEALSLKEQPQVAKKDGQEEPQSPASPAPDLITATTYAFSSASGVALEDMSTGTTQLVGPSLDDTASAVTNIGFDFWYDGVRFTQFSVNANGLSRLGATVVSGAFDNSTGFATVTNAPKIAPYFEDLCTGSNGNVRFKVIGTAPNRKLIVEWNNMQVTRGAGCAGVGGGTFQMWLFESANSANPGVIQFVYGNGIVASAGADGGASIGLQSGAATNFASVTSSTDTVSYAVANNTNAAGIAAGKTYLFTPNIPLAPTGLTFAPVTATSIQLNWTDNATNEFGYAIYRSLDGVTYAFVTQTAANAVLFNDTGLTPGTTYFYRVFAVTEGALSSPALAGSQATGAPGNDTCNGAGGNWSNPATWTDGSVPTNADNVTIGTGCTVTVDITTAVALNVTIDNGGTLQSPTSGAVINNNLTVSGNVTNNGTLDFSTNGDTSAAILTFGASASNATFGGTGATTDVRAITVAKGAQATVVDTTVSSFTVRGVNTDVAGYLTITSGTFKISGTFTMTNRTFPGPTYVIPLLGGFWLNNPNYTVAATASGTTTNNSGLFRMTQGVYNIGLTGADGMGGTAGATFIVEGGTINAIRIDPQSAVTWTQTAGTINLSGLAANTRSNFGSFELFSSGSSFTMSGGTVNLINATIAATPVDYRVLSATINVTGGVLNVGTAATATNFNFRISGNTPAMTIDNTTNNKTATCIAQTLMRGNVLVNPGATLAINGFLAAPTAEFGNTRTFTNNGTITGNLVGSRFYFLGLGAGSGHIYTGTGVAGTTASPLLSVDFDSVNGVSLGGATNNLITNRVILFTGNVTGANKLELGVGGASIGTTQVGNTTTPTNAGTFDVPFTFNLGTGGQVASYLRTTNSYATGNEINPTRTLTSMTYDDNTAGHTLTIAGGDLTLSNAALALTLTNGRIVTGANTLILSSGTATVTRTNGYVDGNFRKTYSAAASKLFEVGTANGFSPVTVNATAGTFPSTMTVVAVQGPQPSVNPATSIQRYWTLTEGGDLTADLTFQYLDPPDVMGNEANYKVIRVIGGTPVAFPTSTVNGATNQATLTGVSVFSDWTVGEISAPTAAPATISGQVTTASGAPMPGVTMLLSGARSARTITDSNGNYRFTNVNTDNFYTVAPAIVNYHFSPPALSFSLLANKTDATFTGTLDTVITGNVIDTPEYFVRQHYLDFLGREPDESGLNFWSDQIQSCGNDFRCVERRTINVSAAYFLSIEFRETGGLVDGLYQASYGRAPRFNEFMPDTARIAHDLIVGEAGWQELLRTNKQEFLEAWVERAAFRAAYDNLSDDSYVEALIRNTGVTFSDGERGALVSGLSGGTLTRAGVLQQVAENERFVSAKFNERFVRMQYFGYLRRDPDDSGFNFWLNKLNEFHGNFEQAEMVRAFIVSSEYRDRFRR